MTLTWTCARLDELRAQDLYDALALRSLVFVVEQNCVYLDPDGIDVKTWHLLGRDADGVLQAYARLVPPLAKGARQTLPMFGRVVTAPTSRGSGQGRALIAEAIAHCERLWPGQELEINAQAYLERFYASFGFAVTSEPYDEDGILHIDMRRPAA